MIKDAQSVLERAASVPWNELDPDHGSSDWIHEALSGMLDADPETRLSAFFAITSGMFHRPSGTKAAPHCIGILMELAACRNVPDRAALLLYVAESVGHESLDPVPDQCLADRDCEEETRAAEARSSLSTVFYASPLEACRSIAWGNVELVKELLDDPDSSVRIAAGLLLARLSKDAFVASLLQAVHSIAGRLYDVFEREADSLVRAGHAFALGTVASRVPGVRSWLRATEAAASPDDLAGLACTLRLIDLGEPFDGPALGRFVERLVRLESASLLDLPWWSSNWTEEGPVSSRRVERVIGERLDALAERYPEVADLVEERTRGGNAFERANALRFLIARAKLDPYEWPQIAPESPDTLEGKLALASVAVEGNAEAVSRWAAPLIAEALAQSDRTIRLRAASLLQSLAESGCAPEVSHFAGSVRHERDSAVIGEIASALNAAEERDIAVSLDLLKGWLDETVTLRDEVCRWQVWKSFRTLAEQVSAEELSEWLLTRIDDPERTEARDPSRAYAVEAYRSLPISSWELTTALARWLLHDPDPDVRSAAVLSPSWDPTEGDRLPLLDAMMFAATNDSDSRVRLAAVEAFASVLMDSTFDASLAEAVVSTLIQALECDPDARVRAEAATNLALAAPTGEEAQGVRRRQISRNAALGQSAPGNSDAVEALVRAACGDSRSSVRYAAAKALENVGAAVPGLVAALCSRERLARAGAADALASVTRPALVAVPDLFVALALESEVGVRRRIAYALSVLSGYDELEPWVGPLGKALEDPDDQVWCSLGWAVSRVGPAAAPLVPQLATRLGFENKNVREHALFALGKIGQPARSALPAVLPLLHSSSIEIRLLALSTAWLINGDQPPHLETLIDTIEQLMQDPILDVRKRAASVLRSITTTLAPDRRERAKALALSENVQ